MIFWRTSRCQGDDPAGPPWYDYPAHQPTHHCATLPADPPTMIPYTNPPHILSLFSYTPQRPRRGPQSEDLKIPAHSGPLETLRNFFGGWMALKVPEGHLRDLPM